MDVVESSEQRTARDVDWRTGRLAILGGGNIGLALARGLVAAGLYTPDRITITRRQPALLAGALGEGYTIHADNHEAVRGAGIVVIAVQPQQLEDLLHEIRSDLLPDGHLLISLVSGVPISEVHRQLGFALPVVRAMPNTPAQIGEGITVDELAMRIQPCLPALPSGQPGTTNQRLDRAEHCRRNTQSPGVRTDGQQAAAD